MERIRNLPLMNFPDTGGVADKYGVSRISGVKGTPHLNIEETFRKSGYIKHKEDGGMEKKLHHFELRLSRSESRMLHASARAAGMYCSDYLRMLIKGFVPKPAPRAEFYLTLQRLNRFDNPEIREIGRHLQELFVNPTPIDGLPHSTEEPNDEKNQKG